MRPFQKKPAREYIHTPTIGTNVEAIRAAAIKVRALLVPKFDSEAICAYQTMSCTSQDKIDRSYILSDLHQIAKQRFPFFYVAVQHWDDRPDDSVTEWLLQNGYAEVEPDLGTE